MKVPLLVLFVLAMSSAVFSQTPRIEPGVSLELARWRAAYYSDVRYKLNLTLEKMSPVLKGTIEVRVKVSEQGAIATGLPIPIILDWRKIKGHEEKSAISNVFLNGKAVSVSANWPPADAGGSDTEHLIFRDGVVAGENVIKLDFTSPILTSGSAITRYIDKEDGSEYIYSLFVPSDASTAFPVFDQPDLKARFSLVINSSSRWSVVSNSKIDCEMGNETYPNQSDLFRKRSLADLAKNGASKDRLREADRCLENFPKDQWIKYTSFFETKPISTYVFAFAAGPWEKVSTTGGNPSGSEGAPGRSGAPKGTLPTGRVSASDAEPSTSIYVRKSQAAKFKPHAEEVFRLNREAVKYFEQYFDYKFPFPKYDLVLIPEFPFGGMEHAGATFLRESSIIFPQEPTKNDYISRATLIFHETAHQWFGDTVTMRWFDDLWLKEGFATFMAYKALEKIMPEMNAWKVFYERVKQGAYATDSTKGTTPIYQEIKNLSAAKSAYGNIVYNKAPAFLRQAEFYLGEDKFQTAVRAFLRKHEFGNAGWEDLVRELGFASNNNLNNWAATWVKQPGLPTFRMRFEDYRRATNTTGRPGELKLVFTQSNRTPQPRSDSYTYGGQYEGPVWPEALQFYYVLADGRTRTEKLTLEKGDREIEELWGYSIGGLESRETKKTLAPPKFVFTNYGDYGYGIFLLDDKSRDYVLKNIQNEKDPFLRAMMWGALWDSVREGELDPRVFVELVVKVLQKPAREQGLNTQRSDQALANENSLQKPAREQGLNTKGIDKALANARASASDDESTVALLLSRVGTAMNYYLSEPPASAGGQSGGAATGLPAADGVKRPVATAPGSDKNGLRTRVEDMLIERMQNAPTLGQRITFYRAFLNIAASENARRLLKTLLTTGGNLSGSEGAAQGPNISKGTLLTGRVSASVPSIPIKTKDKFDIVTRLLILSDPDAPKLLAELEKTETSDDAKRYAYAARAGIATAENKAKYWNDFINNKQISESWIEAAMGPWNSIRHSELTLPYLQKALQELPHHKRSRKIFFVNGWLGAFIGGQRSEEALAIVNKFLADNPKLDNDLRLKVLENVDLIERAVKIRKKF